MENRVLLYLNTVAAASVDLGLVIAIIRSGPSGSGLVVLSVTVALLPVLLTATVVQHRRITAALP
jgi:hypothetical protein